MVKSKPEDKETPEDELKETPELQEKEETKGTEKHDTGSKAKIPEEFQEEAAELVQEYASSKPCLEYLRSLCDDALHGIREAEMHKNVKQTTTGKKVPQEFTMDSAPSD